MNSGLFFRKKNTRYRFVFSTFQVVFFALIFFGIVTKIHAQVQPTNDGCGVWPRPIGCYLTLWGDKYDWSIDQIKQAQGNGIAFLGYKTQEQGGFDTDGVLKKISTVTTLRMDLTKYRGWNMVGSMYCRAVDLGIFYIGGCDMGSNKRYVRFIDDAFVIRIYQKDQNGNIINESLTQAPLASFLGGGPGFTVDGDKAILASGKPLRHIIKYVSGSAGGSNLLNDKEDGYTGGGGTAGSAPLSIGGAAVAGCTIIPGVGCAAGAILGVTANYLLNTDNPELALSQNAILDATISSTLAKGQPAYLELWYAGTDMGDTKNYALTPAGTKRNEVPDKNQPEGSRVRYFAVGGNISGNLKGDGKNFPYFQIGPTTTFSTPASFTEAAASAQNTSTAEDAITGTLETNNNSILPECDILNGWRPWGGKGSGTFLGCIAQLTYYLIYRPVAWFAGLMGSLFDFFLGYSLDDMSYRANFAVRGWQLVRDISNIFFIIILVWIGFTTALGVGKSSIKSVVPQLILNALLINFSLFGTRVVIDLSNVVSRVFYNQVTVCEKDTNGSCKLDDNNNPVKKQGATKYPPISEVLVSSFNPQQIFSTSVFKNASLLKVKGDVATIPPSESEQAGYFIIITLIGAAILFAVAKMFWGTAFMFLGRVIGLYMTMIFAPFAVLTRGHMPLVGGIKELAWDKWWKDLSNYALLAPIFIFFLYIVATFVQSDFMRDVLGNMDGDSFFENVLYVSIPMLIVYVMIDKGVSIAKAFAGDLGTRVQNWVNGSVGAAVGLGAGVAAFAGRNTIGRGLNFVGGLKLGAKNEKGGRMTLRAQLASNAPNSRLARWGNNALGSATTGSWDVRNAGANIGGKNVSLSNLLNKGISGLGASTKDAVSGELGVGKDAGKGGIVAANKAAAKRDQEKSDAKIDFSHMSDDEAKEAMAAYVKKQADKAAKENWEKQVDNIEAMKGLKEALATAKAKLEAEKKKGDTSLEGNLNIARAEEAVKGATDSFTAGRIEIIKNIKNGSLSKEKQDAEKLAAKEETDRLSKYGKIKDVKTFQTAMRAEYAKNIQDNAFKWGGVFPSALGGTAAGSITTGILASMIPIIGPALAATIGVAIGTGVAARLRDQKGIVEKSLKASIDAATKSGGAGGKLGKALADLDKINDEILKMVKEHMGVDYKSFDDANEDDIGAAIEGEREKLEKLAQEKRDAANTETDPIKKKRMQWEAKNLAKKSQNLDTILEKQRKAQETADKIKKETQDAEDKKKDK